MSLFRRKKDLGQLREDIEKKVGFTIATPRDFRLLRNTINQQMNLIIGLSTLMRVWGYVKDGGCPSKNTLDVLAQFLGYSDYMDYSHVKIKEDEQGCSCFFLTNGISVADQLCEGDRLRLSWYPDRVCDVEYLGDQKFRVLAVQNGHLHVGDTFTCSIMLKGNPLTVGNLTREGMPPMNYVCGKRGGIDYTLLPDDETLGIV